MNQELWLIRGKKPVLWSVPFAAVWHEDRATLQYAVPLTARQIRAIGMTLDQHGKQVEYGKWTINRMYLERLAEMLPNGTDPEAVYSWHRPHISEKPEHQREEVVDLNEFVNDLFLKGVGKTREEVSWWYSQFCNHMADTLLNQEKPVDLQFIKLHLSPYRRNYMLTIMSRFPYLGRSLCSTRAHARDYVVQRSGLDEDLISLDHLALNRKEGYCYKYVEVEHTPKWFRTVRRVEKARLALLGATKYAACVMDSVRSRLKLSIKLYVLWLCDLAKPTAQDVEGGREGELRLVPHRPPSPIASNGVRTHFVPVVVANKLPKFKAASPLAVIYEPDQLLPEVPDVQPKGDDMRDGGRELLQRDLAQPGTPGMLVSAPG